MSRGAGGREREALYLKGTISVWDNRKVLETGGGDDCTIM